MPRRRRDALVDPLVGHDAAPERGRVALQGHHLREPQARAPEGLEFGGAQAAAAEGPRPHPHRDVAVRQALLRHAALELRLDLHRGLEGAAGVRAHVAQEVPGEQHTVVAQELGDAARLARRGPDDAGERRRHRLQGLAGVRADGAPQRLQRREADVQEGALALGDDVLRPAGVDGGPGGGRTAQ